MSPDDPRHGKVAGYQAGCREDCCRRPKIAHQKRRRLDQGRGVRYMIPAHGTHRRIRALMSRGWPGHEIARRAGWSTRGAVDLILLRDSVYRGTHARIVRVYDELWMREGPSDITRRRSEAAGWPSPLAWDDETIDDPDARPQGVDHRRAQRLARYPDLHEMGLDGYEMAARRGVTVDAVQKWWLRNRPDLYDQVFRRGAA